MIEIFGVVMVDMHLTPDTTASMLEEALARGLTVPVYIVAVSSDGQVIAVAFEEPGRPCRTLCTYPTGTDFLLPLNLYLSDDRGEAIRAIIEADSEKMVWVN